MYPRLIARVGAVILLLAPTSTRADEPAAPRNAWRYQAAGKDGWFVAQAGKHWLEMTPDGRELSFEEKARTAKYVELFDDSRTIWVRLYDDRAEFRQGAKPEWYRLCSGKWAKAGDAPKPTKREYRIRLAYFVPTDRKPTPDYDKKIRVVMHLVAEVYRQDFESRGIRSKGLRFESRDGEPVVHLIRGRRKAAFYNKAPDYDPQNQWKTIIPEIPASVGTPNKNVIVVFAETYDDGPALFEWPGGVALGGRTTTEGGVGLFSAWVLRPEFCATTVKRQKELLFDKTPIKGRIANDGRKPNSPRFEFIEDGIGAVAHELGHALGLPHDTRQDRIDIMGNGFRNLRWNFTEKPDPKKRAQFSDDNARILYTSRYLASDLDLTDRLPPSVQLRFAGSLKVGAKEVKVSVTASDNQGLRAILFFAPAQDTVVGGRALKGKTQTFEQTLPVKPLKARTFRLEAWLTDDGGNLTRAQISSSVEK